MQIETAKTVRDLVLDKPAAARIFESLGIDYCSTTRMNAWPGLSAWNVLKMSG